jgi:hypothetical protein
MPFVAMAVVVVTPVTVPIVPSMLHLR